MIESLGYQFTKCNEFSRERPASHFGEESLNSYLELYHLVNSHKGFALISYLSIKSHN